MSTEQPVATPAAPGNQPAEQPQEEQRVPVESAETPGSEAAGSRPPKAGRLERARLVLLGLAVLSFSVALWMAWPGRELVATLDFRSMEVVAHAPPRLEVGSILSEIEKISIAGLSSAQLRPCPPHIGSEETCDVPAVSLRSPDRGLAVGRMSGVAGPFVTSLTPMAAIQPAPGCQTTFNLHAPFPSQLLFELEEATCPVHASTRFAGGDKVAISRLIDDDETWSPWTGALSVDAPLSRRATVGVSFSAPPATSVTLWREATIMTMHGRVASDGKISGGVNTTCNVVKNQDVWLHGKSLAVSSLAFDGDSFPVSIEGIEEATVGGSACRLAWQDRPYLGAMLFWLSGLCGGLAASVRFFEDLKKLLASIARKDVKAAPRGEPEHRGPVASE